MATLYAVAAPFSWTSTAGLNWATSSGGVGGHAAPTIADNVIIDDNSGVGTITIAGGSACASLDTTLSTNTIAGSTSLTISAGGLTWGAGITLTYTGPLTFADTSGTTRLITSNGKNFLNIITINGSGGVFQLADALSSTHGLIITTGTFDFNSQNTQFSTVAYNIGGTKGVRLGNSQIIITGTGNAWNAIATGTTQTTGGASKIIYTDASSSTKTFTGSSLTYDDIAFTGGGTGNYALSLAAGTMRDFTCSAGSSTGLTLSNASTYRNINLTGFTGTLTAVNTSTLNGSLTLGSGMTNSGTGNLNFQGSGTITSNGVSFGQLITILSPGVVALSDNFLSTNNCTLTSGSFNTNGHAFTCKTLLSNNTNTRSLTITGSAVTLTGTGVVLEMLNGTGATVNALGSSIALTDASASSKQLDLNNFTWGDILIGGSGSGSYTINGDCELGNLYVSNTGAATLTLTGGSIGTPMQVGSVDFTGFNGTLAGGSAMQISGNLTCGAGMTWSNVAKWGFDNTSGIWTITTNGVSINSQLTFGLYLGPGAEWHLADDYTYTGTSVPSMKFYNGIFRSQGHTVYATEIDGSPTVSEPGFGPRTIDFSGSEIYCSSNVVAWYFRDLTDCTLIMTGSTIHMTSVHSGGSRNFQGGGGVYGNLVLAGGGTDSTNIQDSNTFDSIVSTNTTAAGITFDAGAVTTITKTFSAYGMAESLLLVKTTVGVQTTLSLLGGDSVNDYLSINNCLATGGARWFAGRHSVNLGNNNGWRFTDQYRSPIKGIR